MKRLLSIAFIIGIPVIILFEYLAYRRVNPPSDFAYQTSEQVDLAYHDKSVLAAYFRDATELESLGRYAWKEYDVDVLSDQPKESPEKDLVEAYRQLKAKVRQQEAMLLRSAALKDKGYDSLAVKMMLEKGYSEATYRTRSFLQGKPYLQFEEQGVAIFKVQEMLKAKGYDLPVDGYFEKKTLEAVKSFQKSKGIFPTGRVGDLTLQKLFDQ
jgi:murein L,D-transpeptidase YcbB/YkuD